MGNHHAGPRTFGLSNQDYGLLTLHRPSNVDDSRTFKEIMTAVKDLSMDVPILFPCHVRTRERVAAMPELLPTEAGRHGMILLEPLGYLEFLSLMCDARLVLTDSGGIQEETTVLGIPCVTLRHKTERPVTIEHGTNALVGTSHICIVEAGRAVLRRDSPPRRRPDFLDGRAAERIIDVLERHFHAGSSVSKRMETAPTSYSGSWVSHANVQ